MDSLNDLIDNFFSYANELRSIVCFDDNLEKKFVEFLQIAECIKMRLECYLRQLECLTIVDSARHSHGWKQWNMMTKEIMYRKFYQISCIQELFKNVAAHYYALRGLYFMQRKDFFYALECFEQALNNCPWNEVVWEALDVIENELSCQQEAVLNGYTTV